MKLHDNKLQWVFDQCEELQQAVCTLDLLHENIQTLPKAYEKIDYLAHNKALSILLVLMGERIPKNYFTVNDYVDLYETIACNDKLDLTDE